MALGATGGAAGLNQIKPANGVGGAGGVSGTGNVGGGNKPADGADFRQALSDAFGAQPSVKPGITKADLGAIKAQMPSGVTASTLKFSNHSLERMHSRGISYSPEQMKSIENAVAKAAAKGSKDTLVLTDNSALIVSVKNGTVVTVMDRATMKENVFTNIDSTVMA
jgi:flagellar operon protein